MTLPLPDVSDPLCPIDYWPDALDAPPLRSATPTTLATPHLMAGFGSINDDVRDYGFVPDDEDDTAQADDDGDGGPITQLTLTIVPHLRRREAYAEHH
jgi:hypothetical protein